MYTRKTSSKRARKKKKVEKLLVKPTIRLKSSLRIYPVHFGEIDPFLLAGILTKLALLVIFFQMLRLL
jgi:hypothetical protein